MTRRLGVSCQICMYVASFFLPALYFFLLSLCLANLSLNWRCSNYIHFQGFTAQCFPLQTSDSTTCGHKFRNIQHFNSLAPLYQNSHGHVSGALNQVEKPRGFK